MIKLILTDIEGTISSISFVKDVLFPYAKKKLPEFIERHYNDDNIQEILKQTEAEAHAELDKESFIDLLAKWIDEDKKATPLKTLQGYIWESGFKEGEFKSHFYPDALEKLKLWKNQNFRLYVYSSGSIFAQKLFFTYTEEGNLLSLFDGHFDTTIGNKKERESYEKIAREVNCPPENILFLSDIEGELDAAKKAGFQTILISRAGLKNLGNFTEFTDFIGIDINKI